MAEEKSRLPAPWGEGGTAGLKRASVELASGVRHQESWWPVWWRTRPERQVIRGQGW